MMQQYGKTVNLTCNQFHQSRDWRIHVYTRTHTHTHTHCKYHTHPTVEPSTSKRSAIVFLRMTGFLSATASKTQLFEPYVHYNGKFYDHAERKNFWSLFNHTLQQHTKAEVTERFIHNTASNRAYEHTKIFVLQNSSTQHILSTKRQP